MKKRIISLASAIAVSLSALGVTAFADTNFIDLDSGHWAHSYVDYLVNAGTVRGYDDGSFKPDNTVTRAEFAKMMGVGDNYRNDTDYPDVPADHWAYEYVMTANFGEKIENFKPDAPITRLETLKLLWNRQGAPDTYKAPAIITNQVISGGDKAMVAWAYATNLMSGNDGVHLRLYDTLSRAESAVLIFKSQNPDTSKEYNFAEMVNDDILKNVFEQSNLFDDNTYSKDRTFTNGEIARAAMRFILYEYDLGAYIGYSNKKPEYTHEYAVDNKILCEKMWGLENSNLEFVDKTADKLYAYSAFSFAAGEKMKRKLISDGISYADAAEYPNENIKAAITDLATREVMFYADNTLRINEPLTARDVAVLLLQINEYCPIGKTISALGTEGKKFGFGNVKIATNLDTYPVNKDDYAAIYVNIPNTVYEFPYSYENTSQENKPSLPLDEYQTFLDFYEGFAKKLNQMAQEIKANKGTDVEFIIYPNLVYGDSKGYLLRVLCQVKSVSGSVTPEQILPDAKIITNAGVTMKAYSSFYAEIWLPYATIMY